MHQPRTILARARHALNEFFRLEAAGGILLMLASLLALLCALPLMSNADTPDKRALAVLFAALCVLTVFMETMLLFDNERDYLLKYSPQVYYGIQRALFPY